MYRRKIKGQLEKYILAIVIYLVAVLVGFVVLLFYAGHENATLKENPLNLSYDTTENNEIFVEPKVSEGWPSDDKVGCEYDFDFSNNSTNTIRNWTVLVPVTDDVTVDGCWNAEYEIKDGNLIFTPVDYDTVIAAGDQFEIGTILYSNEVLEISEIDVTYYKYVIYTELPAFKALVVALILGVLAMFVVLFIHFKIKEYESRHQSYKTIVNQALRTIANIIDTKDEYTRGHSQRVAIYSKLLAERMGMSEADQERIYYIGLLHDIGKIGIPQSILTKPGRLTDEEYEIIKRHPQMGGNIIKDFTAIKGAENGVKYHHERYDGKGYNEGLAGEEIPLEGRIIAVADAYDAMSSKRCYRDNLTYDYILNELKKNSGTQFDPKIVPYMIDMIEGGYAPVSEAEMKEYQI